MGAALVPHAVSPQTQMGAAGVDQLPAGSGNGP